MRLARVLAAAAILIGAGLVHGRWTDRWRTSRALEEMSARLDSVPAEIGSWSGRPVAMGARELAAAGAVGHLSRSYRDAERGAAVTVLLICGLPGDIASHPPTVCYPGAGYEIASLGRLVVRPGPSSDGAVFRTAIARPPRPGGPGPIRICWAWNDGDGWRVPEDPRLAFAAEPALCKLYVIQRGRGVGADPEGGPCDAFLRELLPVLDRTVFDGPDGPGRAPRDEGDAPAPPEA